jgi:hypothetical protein
VAVVDRFDCILKSKQLNVGRFTSSIDIIATNNYENCQPFTHLTFFTFCLREVQLTQKDYPLMSHLSVKALSVRVASVKREILNLIKDSAWTPISSTVEAA